MKSHPHPQTIILGVLLAVALLWIVPLVTGVPGAAFLAATLFARRVIGPCSDARET
jgi:hypothetical protein